MKIDKNRELVLKCTAVFLYPLFLCLFYCLIRGINIFELYLPNSINNDSLFYYKMVECILHGGMPKGYFGFNESRALVGSFAAWNPLLLLPWTVWGLLFGWNYSAMLLSNVIYFSLALTGFVLLSHAKWKNILTFMALMLLYPSLPIHLLSGLPETAMICILILYFGLAIRMEYSKKKTVCLVFLFLCSSFLTILRPYMLILMIFPVLQYIKTGKKTAWLISFLVLVSTAGIYVLISHYLSAPYFYPLFDLRLFELLLGGHLRGAAYYVIECMKTTLPDIGNYMKDAFRFGLTAGTHYVVSLLCALILLICCIREKNKQKNGIRLSYVAATVVLLAAVILMLGKANEGGRHFWCFSVAGLLLCSMEINRKNYTGNILLAALLVVFLCRGALVPTDYDVPAADASVKANVEYWEKTFAEQDVRASEEISYDNTVIWILVDYADGNPVITDHRELYALPEGMGISCCLYNYVSEQFDMLKSRYIAMPTGCDTAARCAAAGMKEIGRTEQVCIYENIIN